MSNYLDKSKLVKFVDTKEQSQALKKALDGLKGVEGALMPALQKAQDIYGYLPLPVIETIAANLGKSLSEVYGVATFYTQFTLTPKGKYKISVCMGTACYVKGAGEIFDKFKDVLKIDSGECTPDGKFSLDATRCLGCCGLAPVLTVNEDVYAKVKTDEVKKIVESYK